MYMASVNSMTNTDGHGSGQVVVGARFDDLNGWSGRQRKWFGCSIVGMPSI